MPTLEADDVGKLKVTELKKELDKRRLSKNGKKEELVERLAQAIADETSEVEPRDPENGEAGQSDAEADTDTGEQSKSQEEEAGEVPEERAGSPLSIGADEAIMDDLEDEPSVVGDTTVTTETPEKTSKSDDKKEKAAVKVEVNGDKVKRKERKRKWATSIIPDEEAAGDPLAADTTVLESMIPAGISEELAARDGAIEIREDGSPARVQKEVVETVMEIREETSLIVSAQLETVENELDYGDEVEGPERIVVVASSKVEERSRRVSDHIVDLDEPKKTSRKRTPPRRRSKTNWLRIRHLMRPFTMQQIRTLLSREGEIKELWLDRVKSCCFVEFTTQDAAEATRQALHGTRWPSTNTNDLDVDYADEERFQRFKAADSGVSLDKSRKVNEDTRQRSPVQRRKSAERPPRRSDEKRDPKRDSSRREERVSDRRRRSPERRDRRKPASPEVEEVPVKLLDDLFRKTKCTPHVYWLPLTEEESTVRRAIIAEKDAARAAKLEQDRIEAEAREKRLEQERLKRREARQKKEEEERAARELERAARDTRDKEKEKEKEKKRAKKSRSRSVSRGRR